MSKTVIVYGPQGSGKILHAELLRDYFGCETIVEDWLQGDFIIPGALHLTSMHPVPGVVEHNGAKVIAYSEALLLARKANPPQLVHPTASTKASNPKDAVGVRKWRNYCTIPSTVIAEVGVAMLEGHMKGYGRHNYRVAGVRASVYVDAAKGHIDQWWEGEDIDRDIPGPGLSHITKAIASLVVLRDAMIQDMLNDDRPPRAKLDKVRSNLQAVVEAMFDKYPDPVEPYTEVAEQQKRVTAVIVDGGKITIDASKLNTNILQPGDLYTPWSVRNGGQS